MVAVGVELLHALAYAHSQGIVHRDVKPQNVMLANDGHVKVMDFGIAHLMDSDTLTGDGDVIGTIAYMSPEQAAGRRVQPPSDVYSAGMVLYELLAGAHPLRGDTPAETLSNVAGGTAAVAGRAAARPAGRARHPGRRGLCAAPVRAADADVPQRGLRRPAAQRQPREPASAKARRLVRPLGRAAEVAERAGGGALAAVTSAVVLGALPAYPQSWTLPLVAVTAAVWAVVPEAGLAFLLGSLAFPVFNVSLSLGGAYLAFAVALFLAARARPIVALWPAFALVLTPAYLTLLAPAAAALLGRLRGPLTAAWAGVGTVLFLLLTRAPRGPFTLEQPRWRVSDAVAAAGDPLTAAGRVLAHAFAAPTLVQAAVWAGLAAALGYALTRRRLETRLWIWSLSFAAVFALYRIVPVVVWGYPASLWPLVWSVAVPAP